jgi:hypothetical protein
VFLSGGGVFGFYGTQKAPYSAQMLHLAGTGLLLLGRFIRFG